MSGFLLDVNVLIALIDPSHSQRLMALRPGTVSRIVQGAAHNDLQRWPAYGRALTEALTEALTP